MSRDSERIDVLEKRVEACEKEADILRDWCHRITVGLRRHLNGEGKEIMESVWVPQKETESQ